MGLMGHADVVAHELAQHFVLHGSFCAAANIVPKLRLHHAERALDVAPQVIPLEELVAAEVVVVEHPLPDGPRLARDAVHLERDERRPATPFRNS